MASSNEPTISIYLRPPYLKAEQKFHHAEYRWWGYAFALLLVGGVAVLLGKLLGRGDIIDAAWPAALCTSCLPVLFAIRVFRRILKLIDHAYEIDRRKFNAWLAAEISRKR